MDFTSLQSDRAKLVREYGAGSREKGSKEQGFTHIWTLHPNLGFFGKVKRCVKFYRQYCIGKAQESRFCEEELRSRLDWAMESLQSDRAKLVREYGTGSREKGSKEQGLMKQIFFGYFCH
jgi:hypothetical protein